jgi:hypothetical protein
MPQLLHFLSVDKDTRLAVSYKGDAGISYSVEDAKDSEYAFINELEKVTSLFDSFADKL